MAEEIVMTPENKPLLDALIQIVAGIRNPAAEDALVNAIQELVRLRAFVHEVVGDHEHHWEAVDPQEVWACETCHEYSQDYATDVQTRAQALLSK